MKIQLNVLFKYIFTGLHYHLIAMIYISGEKIAHLALNNNHSLTHSWRAFGFEIERFCRFIDDWSVEMHEPCSDVVR